MTLLEIAIAMPITLVALGVLVQLLFSGAGLRESGRASWQASSAAQDTLERMRNEDFGSLFVMYNSDPFDDPNGPGTAPGATFEVEGLTGVDGEPVGEVILPTWNSGSEVVPVWELREDRDDPVAGTPRDLNGDSRIDADDHSGDYSLLPILVRLRWRGPGGVRELRLRTILTEMW